MQLYKQICLCFMLSLSPMIASARIVFLAAPTRAEDPAIYVMDDDGSNRTLVYNGKPNIYEVRWSPDGQIAFETRGDFYLMNTDVPDVTNPKRLTLLIDLKGVISTFSFSPDGQQIMFALRQTIDDKEVRSIQKLNVQTRKIKKIRDIIAGGEGGTGSVSQLDWSPDGKDVLFSTPILLGGAKLGNSIYIMDASGRNMKELLTPPVGGELNIARWDPRWSPDGTQFVYRQAEYVWEERKPGVRSNIKKAYRTIISDKAGQTLRRLNVPKNLLTANFAWMDNGKSIVFVGEEYDLNAPAPAFGEEPPDHIYKYNLQTNKLVNLTVRTNEQIRDVDWIDDDVLPVSPQGKKKVTWGTVKQQNSK